MASSQLMVQVMGEIPLFNGFSPIQVKQRLGICKLKTGRDIAQIQAEDSGDDGEVQQQEKTQHQARLSMLECQLRQQQQKLDAAVELLIQQGNLTLSSGYLGAEDLSGYGLDGFIDKPRDLDQFEALVEVTLQK
ncbi:MAG: hypothetical protein HOL51_08075 [Gemmatimonadetes bacterium]|jgi:hypothetical protein|nr:hypothetical protein [Gemmatimonadota bacterium]MBT6620379.1 hypothetical protein [Gemmatimonadota bacterium]MBT6905111.1 hypothetical protein [Gemmatimonadota bacterium]MBT7418433.1 hypothetical protein [Gemmatimonadota bacterium]